MTLIPHIQDHRPTGRDRSGLGHASNGVQTPSDGDEDSAWDEYVARGGVGRGTKRASEGVQTPARTPRAGSGSVAVDEALAARERIRGAADTVALAVGRSGHRAKAIVSSWMRHIRGLAPRAGCRLRQSPTKLGVDPAVISKTVQWRKPPNAAEK